MMQREMTAGRALDALVENRGFGRGTYDYQCRGETVRTYASRPGGAGTKWMHLPEWGTDAALIPCLMDRILALDGEIVSLTLNRHAGRWAGFVDGVEYLDAYDTGEFDGDTANLALCHTLLYVAEAVRCNER
jgi:hypothetical protein